MIVIQAAGSQGTVVPNESPLAEPAPSSRSEFLKGWRVLIACALGGCAGLNMLPIISIGAAVVPLGNDTGWGRADIMLSYLILKIVGAIFVPLAGLVIDKYGARRTALLALPLYAACFASVGFMPKILLAHYAAWVAIGITGAATSPVIWSKCVAGWFVANRGLGLGLWSFGVSMLASVLHSASTWVASQYGWREVFWASGAVPLFIALPVVVAWFREAPASIVSTKMQNGTGLGEPTLTAVLKDYRFWMFFSASTFVSFGIVGPFLSLKALLSDHHFTPALVGTMVSVSVIVGGVGKIGIGWLLDRLWAPAVVAPILFVAGLSILLLTPSEASTLAAFVCAAGIALTISAITDVTPFIISRYFGLRHFSFLFGFILAAYGIGGGISASAYGRVFDLYGSYRIALIASTIFIVVSALIIPILGRYPTLAAPKQGDLAPKHQASSGTRI
jgi:OFA family oxalate/formate antiporter-like MFS transporter